MKGTLTRRAYASIDKQREVVEYLLSLLSLERYRLHHARLGWRQLIVIVRMQIGRWLASTDSLCYAYAHILATHASCNQLEDKCTSRVDAALLLTVREEA